MQRLEVSGAVRLLYGSLGVKGLTSAVAQRFYLFNFVCLRIVLSFIGVDYRTNSVPSFYHTLIVFMVHFTVLRF